MSTFTLTVFTQVKQNQTLSQFMAKYTSVVMPYNNKQIVQDT